MSLIHQPLASLHSREWLSSLGGPGVGGGISMPSLSPDDLHHFERTFGDAGDGEDGDDDVVADGSDLGASATTDLPAAVSSKDPFFPSASPVCVVCKSLSKSACCYRATWLSLRTMIF
jgi:hypothetical protein